MQLFDRQARGISLSTQGEAWLPHVQVALSQLTQSTADLFEAPRRKITIAASASVIELWIVPRLAEIARRLPHLQLAFETIQRLPDYSRYEADFEIRFGDGHWPGREARRLFAEELTPMAAPALAAAGGLHSLPRIATSGPRASWRDWSAMTGEPPSPLPLLRFDTFVQALRAAEEGAGALLGSLALCRASLDSGRLLRLTDGSLRMETGYWITWPQGRSGFAERNALLCCLTDPGASRDAFGETKSEAKAGRTT
ncbi:MAG TPA: LysR substrate-binding domain-containing protein [Pararhizobium sp.]|nr:LysR substrate-binding domain-containing protein [Pararhizobium sp.]